MDLDTGADSSTIADTLLAELMSDDGLAEIGHRAGRRVVLESIWSSLPDEPLLEPNSHSVFLVTGGARGITADVALELAERYRPTLILAGRSPLPPAYEALDTAGITGLHELKRVLIEQSRTRGEPPVPARIEAQVMWLLKDREIRTNLAALRQAGATVYYHSVDVRDEQAFGTLITHVYSSFGKIDGVIHGAGIIEDKLVQDKPVESFERVFGTKVDSAFILSRYLRPESLRFLIFFSSVAGRFGNRGQGDYAAANEVLNKLAIYLDSRWPTRVVAINWGPWAKSGMVSPELEREFARRGVALVSPAVGRRRFDEEVRRGRKGVSEVILGGDVL